MGLLHKVKMATFTARLQMAESERNRLVEMATKSQVSLARIAYRLNKVEYEIRALSRELKLLEMLEPKE